MDKYWWGAEKNVKEEVVLKENKKMFDYVNLTQYHKRGYTGKGNKVCIIESDTDHRKTTIDSLLASALDCEIIYIKAGYANQQEYDAIYSDILNSGAKLVTMSLTDAHVSPENSLKLINAGITTCIDTNIIIGHLAVFPIPFEIFYQNSTALNLKNRKGELINDS